MIIKTKLKISTVIFIGLALAIGLILFWVDQELNEEIEENRTVSKIIKGVFELNILTHDYFHYGEDRAKIQWQLRYDSIGEILDTEIFGNQEEQERLDVLRESHEKIKMIFLELIANIEQQEKGFSSQELEERLVAQLSVESLVMISAAFELGEEVRSELTENQQKLSFFILAVILMLILIIIIGSLFIMKTLVKPIIMLQKGAEIIGTGNFKHRIDIKSEDEIGNLATSFNEMTVKLEKIYPALKERIKELSAIYETSKILEESTDLEKALYLVAKTTSSAYQFPELACARIIYNGREYQTTNFKETEWKQTAIIKLAGKETGMVEVFYLEKRPFLVEEEKMIKEIAAQVGNIAERKKMEEQLKKHSEQLEKKVKNRTRELEEAMNRSEVLLSSIGDGVFAINKERDIIHFNRAAEELSGYKVSDVVGKPYYDVLKFIKEKDRSENIAFIRKALKGEATDMVDETVLIRKDQGELPVTDSAAPMKNEKGEVIGAIVVFRDASKERKIQQMRSEFMSLATHELKTPLGVMNGYLEMLIDERTGKLTKEQRKLIDQTMNASNRLLRLAKELLDVARFEEGREKVEPLIIDPINLAEKAVGREFQELFKQKKQKFTLKKPERLPKIKVDPKFIMTSIQNLLSNASKYTPEKGKIEFELSQKDKRILFRVTDSGIGIPSEEQFKVFQRFFRASNTTRLEKGTGLGLYMTKLMIELSGGRIWFKSEEKKGTTFYFSLPVFRQ